MDLSREPVSKIPARGNKRPPIPQACTDPTSNEDKPLHDVVRPAKLSVGPDTSDQPQVVLNGFFNSKKAKDTPIPMKLQRRNFSSEQVTENRLQGHKH